jgi:hypothetical protein
MPTSTLRASLVTTSREAKPPLRKIGELDLLSRFLQHLTLVQQYKLQVRFQNAEFFLRDLREKLVFDRSSFEVYAFVRFRQLLVVVKDHAIPFVPGRPAKRYVQGEIGKIDAASKSVGLVRDKDGKGAYSGSAFELHTEGCARFAEYSPLVGTRVR